MPLMLHFQIYQLSAADLCFARGLIQTFAIAALLKV